MNVQAKLSNVLYRKKDVDRTSQRSRSKRARLSKVTTHSTSPQPLLLRGKKDILAHSGLLEQLAVRCGQPAAMHWLQYFLSPPNFRSKQPCLVLLPHAETSLEQLRVEDVRAAVLLFEYRILGLPTGVFCTDDSSGFRTVISPVEDRLAATETAVHALLQAGAKIIWIARDDGGRMAAAPRLATAQPVLWAQQTRQVAKTLLLEPTYEATLKNFGKSTRFNLGYYRRRLLAKMPLEFIADARGMLTADELRSVNAGSLNPTPPKEMDLQYNSACHLPGGFLIGLRGPQGQWLSLVGGWRQEGNTVLDWQINARGHEQSSLTTVMRSYFMESEIARGTRVLTFYGGTPHTMQHAFVKDQATDLIVRRRDAFTAFLVGVARLANRLRRRVGRTNFLAEVLSDRNLQWHDPQRMPEAAKPRGQDASLPPEPHASTLCSSD